MKKLFLLFLVLFSFNAFCQNSENLDELILEIEDSEKPEGKIQESNVIEEEKAVKNIEKNEKKSDDIEYRYSYAPVKNDNGYDEGVFRGRTGRFYLSLLGELTSYKYGPKRNGFITDAGWLIDLKYFHLGIGAIFGYRSASKEDPDEEHLFVGFKTSFRYELLDWLIPFADIGSEFVNIQTKGYWQYPVILYGGGLIFDLGHIFLNDRSFAKNHRIWGMERLGLVLGFYGLHNLSNDPYAKNALSVRMGLSLEI
jgi:hypothetical protein